MMADEGDEVDVDAQMRLQTVTLGMKQQADELLLANQLDKVLTLYRELLMHLSRSQVTMLQEKELVISCRMNVLAALSKAKHWKKVVEEATETLTVVAELKEAQGMVKTRSEEQERENHVLSRAFYFRGFALMQLGTYVLAKRDLCRSMELNPMDESVQNDYKELQTVMEMEKRIKQLVAMSIKSFQDGHYKAALEMCMNALRESQLLQKTELTGLIHGNLAAIYVKMKDDANAIEHYKRAILITQSGVDPSAVQNERVHDIMDSLAECYLRKRDYSLALSVIEDQIKLAPLCAERKDREAMMYLNGGQVCYKMGRYPQAVEYLEIGHSVAKRLKQVDVALNCAYWLSKSYAKTGALEKALKTLDAALVTAEKEAMVAPIADVLEKFLLARVDLLDAEINAVATESELFKDPLRESQLWHTLKYFEGKGQIFGHARTAEVLLHFLEAKSGNGSDQQRSDMMQALALVDCVNVGKLSTSVASIVMKLALTKADLMLSHSSTGPTEVKELLVKLLCDLEISGSANPSHPHELRVGALLKLVDICIHEDEDESNEEVRKLLEEAINVLRANKGVDAAASKARLVVLLPKVARWKAARENIVGAKEILEENVQRLRDASDSNSDLLFESLVGLCVVQIKLGMLEEATQVMNEVEGLTAPQNSHEVSVIRDRLQTAMAAARSKKAKMEDPLFEKKQSVIPGQNFVCSINPVWWSRWRGPLIACVAAVAMAFMIF